MSINSTDIGEAGGQVYKIERSIRTFLEQMSEGNARPASSVLKELIQNADDAGASEIEITLDTRIVPKELSDDYRLLMEASIIIRNDAQFKSKEEFPEIDQDDFEAICDVANGHKRADTVAAGRFGIGFNSVYFLTDSPVIFSRDEIHIFDLLHLLPFKKNNGWKFHLRDFPSDKSSAGEIKAVLDWCFPKSILKDSDIGGMAKNGDKYKQSVFRLPLRCHKNGANAICDTIYDNSVISRLIDDMVEEAPRSILFLKNIKRIIFSTLDNNGYNQSSCVEISPNPPEFFAFLEAVKNSSEDKFISGFDRVITVTNQKDKRNEYPFCVWHRVYPKSIPLNEIRKRFEGKDKAIPWVSVALPLNKLSCSLDGSANAKWRVFLPLLEEGPSSCYFSGAFFVGPSRQRLDYKTDEGVLKTEWNQALVEYGLAELFSEISLDIPKKAKDLLNEDPKAYLSLFPDKPSGKQSENLSQFFEQSFSAKEWYLSIPDIWGDKVEIFRGEDVLTIERIPEWLLEYKNDYRYLSTEQRKFVTWNIGGALKDKGLKVIDYNSDIAFSVLKNGKVSIPRDIELLWKRLFRDDSIEYDLNELWAFTCPDNKIIKYDAEYIYIVDNDTNKHEITNFLRSLKLPFQKVFWVKEEGLAKVNKDLRCCPNIVSPSNETAMEILRRLPEDNPQNILRLVTDVERIVDFLLDQDISKVQDLKLGILVKTASNKERLNRFGTVFLRTDNFKTKVDEAIWDLWFRKNYAEIDPQFAKQINRLLLKHPQCWRMLSSKNCEVLEARTENAFQVIRTAINNDPEIIAELLNAINEEKNISKGNSTKVSEFLIDYANKQWDDWLIEDKQLFCRIPIFRTAEGKYIALDPSIADGTTEPECKYWRQTNEDLKDAPIELNEGVILQCRDRNTKDFYRNRLGIEEYGRVAVIKVALDQIGYTPNDDKNDKLLEYLIKYYNQTIEEKPEENDVLKSKLMSAKCMPCLGSRWCEISECNLAHRVVDRLREQGWNDKDIHKLIGELYSDLYIVEFNRSDKLSDFLVESGIHLDELDPKGILQRVLNNQNPELDIKSVFKLIADNYRDGSYTTSDWLLEQKLPTISGNCFIKDVEQLTNRFDFPDSILSIIAPNVVDMKEMVSFTTLTHDQVKLVLSVTVTKDRMLHRSELLERFVTNIDEIWNATNSKEARLKLLSIISNMEMTDRLIKALNDINIILTTNSKEPWRKPNTVVSPEILQTKPPFIDDFERPDTNINEDILRLYDKCCGVNTEKQALLMILNKLNGKNDTKSMLKLYEWIESILKDNSKVHADLITALKTECWVLARKGSESCPVTTDKLVINKANDILCMHFFVPSVQLPNSITNKDMNLGFIYDIEPLSNNLTLIAESIIEAPKASTEAYENVYRIIKRMIDADEDLSKLWNGISADKPVFNAFRDSNRFVNSLELFIGNEETSDFSSNLLCLLHDTKCSKEIIKLYEQLGISIKPSINQVINALSSFDSSGNPKEYRKLVDKLIELLKDEENPQQYQFSNIKVLSCAHRYEALQNVYWDDVLGRKERLSFGTDHIIDSEDKDSIKLLERINQIEPYYPKSFRNSVNIHIGFVEDTATESTEVESLIDPWDQYAKDMIDGSSLIYTDLENMKLAVPAKQLEFKTVEKIEISTDEGALFAIKQNPNWEGPEAIAYRDGRILISRNAPQTDEFSLGLLDKTIARELLIELGASYDFGSLKSSITTVLDRLERPSAILRTISSINTDHFINQYKDQAADLEFSDLYDKYIKLKRGSEKHLQIEKELLGILSQKFVAIRREQISGYGYDKSSIIAELIQNAEDAYRQQEWLGMAAPPEKYVKITSSRIDNSSWLSFEHCGRPFNHFKHDGNHNDTFKKDVDGVLKSSGSFKALASDKTEKGQGNIGRFGLGFKSVYLLTDTPIIHSAHWHFRINSGCIPEEIPAPVNWASDLTRIDLPLTETWEDSSLSPEILAMFLPFLNQISKIDLYDGGKHFIIQRIDEIIQTKDNTTVKRCTITIGDKAEHRLYKITENNAQIGLLLDDGGYPVKWKSFFNKDCYAYLPLKSFVDCGLGISHQFSIQSGRTHLNEDMLNQQCATELASLMSNLIGVLLAECSSNTSKKLWLSFWDMWKFDYQNSETSFIVNELSHELFKQISISQIIPTYGSEVTLSNKSLCFYFDDEIPSLLRDNLFEIKLALANHPKTVITPNNTLLLEVIPKIRSLFKATGKDDYFEQYILKIDWKVLIEEFQQSTLLADTPIIINVIASSVSDDRWDTIVKWLKECKVAGYTQSGALVVANLNTLYAPTIDDEQYLPSYKINKIAPDYNDDAIELFIKAGLKEEPLIDDISDWIGQRLLNLESCIDLIRYLSMNNRFYRYSDLQDHIQSKWVPYENAYLSAREAYEHKLIPDSILGDITYRSWLGIETTQIPIEQITPSPQKLDTTAILNRIHEWWEKESKKYIPDYDRRTYPDGLKIGQSKSSYNDSEKSEWLKLLMLGSLQTMGRSKMEQHRTFVQKCLDKDVLEMSGKPEVREKRWLENISSFIDNPSDNHEYYRWYGYTFLPYYQFNRWLDTYINILADLDKYDEPIPVEYILHPRSNPKLTGTGVEAPSMGRALGHNGLHFVLRELVRQGVIKGDKISHHCYVPTKRVRDLLYYITNGQDLESSEQISKLMVETIGRDKSTFNNCFDIPFLFLCEKNQLNLREELIGEAVTDFDSKEYEDD
jgi:hypothetical protein